MPLLGSIIKVSATFRNTTQGSLGDLIDPDAVTVTVSDSTATPTVSNATATRESLGIYSYSWTPTAVGAYTVTMTGVISGHADLVLSEDFLIDTSGIIPETDATLGTDVILTFSSGFSPLLVDPESIQPYVPYASLVEIAVWINRFSIEICRWFPDGGYPGVAYEYITAATLCQLSRLYEGISMGNVDAFTLGDLQIQSGTTSSSSKNNRGNIDSWCQLAEILRQDVKFATANGGMTSAVKASYWGKPLKPRVVRGIRTDHIRRYYD